MSGTLEHVLDTIHTIIYQISRIRGFETIHSLRVTTAAYHFQSGVDEQLIMARTGLRSIGGIRTYKRVGENQKQTLSDVLNSATNGEPQLKKQWLEESTETVLHESISVNTSLPSTSLHAPIIHFYWMLICKYPSTSTSSNSPQYIMPCPIIPL